MKLYFLFIWVRRQGATPVSLANQSLGILPFLLFLVLGVVPAAVFSSAGELKIVSSTASEFHFTLIVDPAQLDWFYDSDSLVSGFTTVQIGIPPGSQPRLVLAEGRQPVEIAEDFFRGRRPSSNSFPLAEVSRTSAIRGRRLVSVRIFPILERRIYTEVEIKVIFTGAAVAAGTVSPDPHFERIFSAVIANYDQFKTWPAPTRTVGKLSLLQPGPFSGVDEWFKISVDQTGLYRVTGLELESAGLNLVNLPSDEVHLYYGGGLPLAVPNEEPRPEFVEIPVILEDGGDGSFDRGDQLLFFGESQDRWVYSDAGSPDYVNNPYSGENVYWLTISSSGAGRRMSWRSDPSSEVVVSTFRRYFRAEQDNMLRSDYGGGVQDYYSWYWTNEGSLTF
jgi:hypothetical protein